MKCYPILIKKEKNGTSLVVQWLRLCASNAGGMGSIPGWGSSACHVVWPKKKKKKKEKNGNCFLKTPTSSHLFRFADVSPVLGMKR